MGVISRFWLAGVVAAAALGVARPAHAADGAWTFIPPAAGPDSLPGPRIGGGIAWDANRDRMILAGGRQAAGSGAAPSPLVVLHPDGQWEAPAVLGPAPPATLGPWAIDRSHNRLVSLAGLSAIWSMDLDTFASRVDSAAGSTPYFDTDPLYAAMDSTRDEILMFGLDVITPGRGFHASLWTLPLQGTPTWVKRSVTGIAPWVSYNPGVVTRFLYDTRRDHFVYLSAPGNGILTLSPQPAWLADPGLPATPLAFGAVYDSTRDLVVTFGGHDSTGSAANTLSWFRPAAPTEPYTAIEPDPSPFMADPVLAFDGARNRMIAAGGHDRTVPLEGAWSYAPPPPPRALVQCDLARAAFPGTTLDFAFRVTNGSSGGARITYEIQCDRAWPGVTRSLTTLLAGGGASGFDLRFAVPDTAAPGPVSLQVVACCNAGTDPYTICGPTLLVVAHPAPPVLVSAVVEGDTAVALQWTTAPGAAVSTTLLRSVDGAALDTVAVLAPDAQGTVAYVDHGFPAGATLRYQLAINTLAGPIWSDPVTLGAAGPVAPTLAFAMHGAALVVRGALDLAFSLPRAGTARLEAYDVRGRLAAARSIDSPGPGFQTTRLAEAGVLRSGVYFLRLSQGGARAQARALVLGAP